MDVQVTGAGATRQVVVDGRRIINEYEAYIYARAVQGFTGTFPDWLDLPAAERAEYEAGAAAGRST